MPRKSTPAFTLWTPSNTVTRYVPVVSSSPKTALRREQPVPEEKILSQEHPSPVLSDPSLNDHRMRLSIRNIRSGETVPLAQDAQVDTWTTAPVAVSAEAKVEELVKVEEPAKVEVEAKVEAPVAAKVEAPVAAKVEAPVAVPVEAQVTAEAPVAVPAEAPVAVSAEAPVAVQVETKVEVPAPVEASS